jgi:vanillate O-demethylase ferredoxin subunit
MHDNMIEAIVTRKWQLAQGYHAVELETRYRSELPPFDDGAIVDLVRDNGSQAVRSHPLWRIPSRRHAFVLGVRQEADREPEQASADFSWNRGDQIYVGSPRSAVVMMDRSARYILLSAGVGATAIAGVARRLAKAGKSFEVHNFARTPERAVFREELDEFRTHARVHHRIGLNEHEIAQATSHAVSPTHASSQIICSGPPSFMNLIERQALEWVYPAHVHKIVLGEKAL